MAKGKGDGFYVVVTEVERAEVESLGVIFGVDKAHMSWRQLALIHFVKVLNESGGLLPAGTIHLDDLLCLTLLLICILFGFITYHHQVLIFIAFFRRRVIYMQICLIIILELKLYFIQKQL